VIDPTRRTPVRADSDPAFVAAAAVATIEPLESRTLMHAGHFHASINFQPARAAVPDGYVVDAGATYGARNGLTYGWNNSHTTMARDRNHADAPDQRYDTFVYLRADSRWELAVPNGRYAVRAVTGDPLYWDNVYRLNVEGTAAINGTSTQGRRWFENTVNVNVTDGRLTVTPGAGAVDNRISFIEVSEVPAAPNPKVAPARPTALSATPYSTAGIALAWTDNANNETGFAIERKRVDVVGGAWQQIATVGANVTGYNSTGLASKARYAYRVRAFNGAGHSAYSNEAAATTLAGSTPSESNSPRWSTLASGSRPRAEAQGAVVGGKLYVLGGVDYSGPYAHSEVYDPATNAWKRIKDLPKKLTHAGTAAEGRNIYLAGGYIGTGQTGWAQTFATREVWRYNVDSDTYTAMPQLPQARGGGALVVLGRALHFIAGGDATRADRGEHWVLDLNNVGAGWSSAATMPNGRSHLTAVVLGGKIYAIGGQRNYDDAAISQTDVHVWDPARPSGWTKVASLPRGVSHHNASTVVRNGRIYVIGGETAPHQTTNKVSTYDPATNRWTDVAPLPSGRTSGVAGVINGAIYFATGSVQTTTWKGAFN
jgi:N-acetylneuraminic acid mutarotase